MVSQAVQINPWQGDWPAEIAVAHHGKHHLYHTAIAYDQVDRLAAFVTQRYVARPERILWAAPLLGSRVGLKVKKAAGHHHPELDGKVIVHSDSVIKTAAARLVGQKKIIHASGEFENIAAEACLRKGWGCHSHVTGAKGLFPKLKKAGLPCLLEMYVGDIALGRRLMLEEGEILGLKFDECDLHKFGFATEHTDALAAELELADYVYCASPFVVETIVDRGYPRDQIILAPYGITVKNPVTSPTIRKPDEPLRAAFVGTEGIRKGLHHAIRALEKFNGKVEIHVFGLNHFEIPGHTFDMTHVHFHGFVMPKQLPAELSRMHCAIMPSLMEGYTFGVTDCLSQGMPGIVTRNTATWIQDGREGFVVPIRDSQAIAESFEKLLDEELRQELSINALQMVREFPWQRYYDSTVAPLQLNSC